MLPEKRLTQLTQMEAILNESNEFLTEAELFLEKWRAFLPRMKKLEDYYFDGDWREDFDAYEQGKIPKDIACGVLSEDLVFNAGVRQQSLSIGYLKLITAILDRENT